MTRPEKQPRLNSAQSADLQVAFARAAEQRGDIVKATAAYREAIKNDHRRADALQRLAVLNDKQGKFQESADLYRRALEADPGNPDVFCDMGYSLYLQRRWAEAEMNLRQAIKLSPEMARAHNNLGLVLAHNGQNNAALAEFRRAGGSAVDAHNNLAFVLTTEGRWDEARTQYRLAATADPASNVAQVRMRELNNVAAKIERPTRTPNARDSAVLTTSATRPVQRTSAALGSSSKDPRTRQVVLPPSPKTPKPAPGNPRPVVTRTDTSVTAVSPYADGSAPK
jgi:Tfp pilus assembly protein PilF